MRFKTLVALLLFVAAIGIVVMAAPASAAKPVDSVTYQGPNGYTVTIYKVSGSMLTKSSALPGMSTMSLSGSISQGGYQWYGKNVNSYTETYCINLYWGNTQNSLRLRIFSPDGNVFGPIYDTSYGGAYDGAIYATVSRSGGVAQGTWWNEIYGDRVAGSQSYNIY